MGLGFMVIPADEHFMKRLRRLSGLGDSMKTYVRRMVYQVGVLGENRDKSFGGRLLGVAEVWIVVDALKRKMMFEERLVRLFLQ